MMRCCSHNLCSPRTVGEVHVFAGIIRRSVDQQTVLMRALLSEYKFDCQHEFWYLESQDSP